MTIKELIIQLQTMSPDARVEIEFQGGGGCDTCGHGGEEQMDVVKVMGLETHVVLSAL